MTELFAQVSGKVQGVGFRATAKTLALKLSLTGHIQNLPTGQVEFVVQGPKEIIDQFIQELHKKFQFKEIKMTWRDPSNQFLTFDM